MATMLPASSRLDRAADARHHLLARFVADAQEVMRAAGGAGNGLRMKSPVRGIVILRRASRSSGQPSWSCAARS